ncbi:hypothetical protein [Actinoplanes friuliensis]|jgi:hypothetical protein|uniref:Uncharacterized protein n=1 Tax=Actinoplanes friuliensis DSM 7358 TaxID=1246995 RepID=U5W7S3_9ACTN|nr:hypothetical protein [Actinoplanes friuliensis]AGZ45037.1 hypothetical protein AFR_33895 [Actinoplanes friuliensis DSM 7358]
MASWILVPCLVTLRNEFNQLAPNRDKASDGSIGDTSHAAASSDHNPDETGNTPYEDADKRNEVHAIDVDHNLRRSGWTMNRCLEIIITRHREGRDNRLQNVIYNRRIWSRSWGWTAREYTGASPHTEHAHFSARYTTAQESDTSPWGLLEEDVTKSEFNAWMTEWARSAAGREALAVAVLTYDPGTDSSGRVKAGGVANPDPVGFKSNPTFGPNYALNRAVLAATLGYQIRDQVENVQATVDALAKGQPVAPVSTQVTPAEALDALGSGLSTEDAAAALRSALGDRAAEVGRLLAG